MCDGTGFEQGRHDPKIWPNILASELDLDLVNISSVGRNNSWIASESASAIARDRYDMVLVAWTGIPKYTINIGLETYSVHTVLRDTAWPVQAHNIATVTPQWLQETGDRLRQYHNDHWDILDLVKAVNYLAWMQDQHAADSIFFINTLCPWSPGYFDYSEYDSPDQLDSYTKNMLQIHTRDDDEIRKLYQMIHQHYQDHGGIQPHRWINLYQPFRKLAVDQIGNGDRHPGSKSQAIFARLVSDRIGSLL